MKQNFFLIIIVMLLCNQLIAQKQMASLPDKTDVWILDKSVSNVDFYHMIKECNGSKVVVVKFHNKNSYHVDVNWSESFSTQLEQDVIGAKGIKNIILQPGITSYSDCSAQKHKEFMTTKDEVSPAYVAVISKFDFINIQVKKAIHSTKL